MVFGRIRSALARAGTLLVLTFVLVRAVIPGGFMPAFDPHSGQIAVVMCSATPGHEVAFLNLPNGQDEDDDRPADGSCPFALCGGTILPEPCVAPYSAPAVYAFEYHQQRATPPPAASPLSPHAPPTGPPASV